MTDELDQSESLNADEEVQDSIPEETVDETTAELAKAKEVGENQRIRAEKAEAKLKALKDKPEKETPKNENYSLQDIRALQDVHDDDVAEIADYAKFKGISIAEAKKNPIVQNTLKTRAEERKTAEATNTTPSRRNSSKNSDEELLNKFSKGELPEEDIERTVKAMIERKKKGN